MLVTDIVPSSLIFLTLMVEEIPSSETSFLTSGARRNIPGDVIFVKILSCPLHVLEGFSMQQFNIMTLILQISKYGQEFAFMATKP
jgi:hypothetical protein